MKSSRLLVLTTALASCACGGCQMMSGDSGSGDSSFAERTGLDKLDLPDGVPWKSDDKPQPQAPARVVATWQDAVMQRQGHASQRGFGGRLFFYTNDSPKPVPVAGQLVVYAFEDRASEKPSRKFVFPAPQFAKHASDSDLGVSYSVWLPWGEASGSGREVALVARFEPLEGGKMIVSEMADSYLPGGMAPRVASGVETSTVQTEVKQASHSVASPAPVASGPPTRGESRLKMETTTIALPRRGG